ncbi:MAG TPA: SURF1 family protein, partial [Candidatus Thioglobus sp.]|nr:SURF1 family protein [Candidatus Thioglobus sp.]
QIESTIISAQQAPAILVNDLKELLDKEHYQVLLKGSYDTHKQFIYDNQIVNATAGYYVLTPFLLNSSDSAILVNRGFVPWYNNRDKLADIKVSSVETTIKVKLIKPIQRIELKTHKLDKKFPIIIQSLNLKKLSELSTYQIIPMIAQLDVEQKNGFFRKWKPFYGSVDKHLGYATQWFLMALVLSIIAIYLLVKNRKD